MGQFYGKDFEEIQRFWPGFLGAKSMCYGKRAGNKRGHIFDNGISESKIEF